MIHSSPDSLLSRLRLGAALPALMLALACQPALTANERAAARGVEMRYLNAGNPSLEAVVSSAHLERGSKFVVVEIREVQNSARVPLSFMVSFRPVRGLDVVLGTFSLYPADNPGRFIVATQGNVEPGGKIVLSLIKDGDMKDVRVGVGSIGLGDR